MTLFSLSVRRHRGLAEVRVIIPIRMLRGGWALISFVAAGLLALIFYPRVI